ncbi:cell division protein ZapA [Anaerosalibacter massiliensis]|uniref:Cell division protein ZapA n=1 Tax=Anaerosalibacter massiliensis TaxID=1347392 RepID=A0A9X2S644_9FIRM|nr:cell division protein ZapA [Anaerosalibacter massiliensis]MCR2045253.1 cell division protein ZapA [Anaerosalibacter massiliensis]
MTEKRKVEVNIVGRNFTVLGNESEEYVKGIAAFVDEKIKEVSSKNEKLNDLMATLLAAFNMADEYYRTYAELEKLKEEVKEPMENYEGLIKELEESKLKIKKLEEECNICKGELLETKRNNESINKSIKKYEQSIYFKESELKQNQKTIKELQDKLYRNQMELIHTKKELEETVKALDKNSNMFSKEEF